MLSPRPGAWAAVMGTNPCDPARALFMRDFWRPGPAVALGVWEEVRVQSGEKSNLSPALPCPKLGPRDFYWEQGSVNALCVDSSR